MKTSAKTLLFLMLLTTCLSGCASKEKTACLERNGAWVKFGNLHAYCVESTTSEGVTTYQYEKTTTS